MDLHHTDAFSGEEGEALEPYKFVLYYNYDWWGIKPFGEDEISKFWKQLYNIEIDMQAPDSDPAAKLNLMMSSGDLPDVILMDRGADNIRAIQNGVFLDLAPFQAKNPMYDKAIGKDTQNLLKVDGKLYAIPHWARNMPTGGNDSWIYNKEVYEAVGSPSLKTFEDLYAFATAIKDDYPTNAQGKTVMPFSVQNDAWDKISFSFYRSMGGAPYAEHQTTVFDGKLQSAWRDPRHKAAFLEGNKWFREGLIGENLFSETTEMLVEKWTDNRGGLFYYDMSQDSVNKFRQIMMEHYPGNEYVVLTDPVYPPANGIAPEKIYADHKETMGWNVHGITNKAKNPQRIFDFLTYMLSWQGSMEMMYGPQGDWWTETKDTEYGPIPVLHTPEAELSSAEKQRIGTWEWSFCNHADPVDLIKYAVNASEPPEKRDWVITMQADVLTPIMYVTDEYAGFNVLIDPLSDLGINKGLQWDRVKEDAPKIIMASSEAEASKIYDDLLAYMDSLGLKEIEEIYNARHDELVATQGFTAFNR